MELRDKLQRLRDGRSYRQIAAAIGCSAESVRRWLDGDAEPSFTRGVAMARLLGVDAAWLADDSADWPPPPAEDDRIVAAVREAMAARRSPEDLTARERSLVEHYRAMPADDRGLLMGVAIARATAPADPEAIRKAVEAMIELERHLAAERTAGEQPRRAGGHRAG
jgi:transcriptional regulator with XRE-family HTH domain